MNSTSAIFREAMAKGVTLEIHCGDLRYRDPNQALSPNEIEVLRERGHETVLAVARLTQPSIAVSAHAAPLTFQQQFALERCGNSFWAIFAVRLSGLLNVNALFRSAQTIFERHGALRTKIVVTDTAVSQQVNQAGFCDVRCLDLENRLASCGNTDIDACFANLVYEWLDAAESTFALRLLRISSQEHVLIILWDHLFEDYVSCVLLFRELWGLYSNAMGQHVARPTSLPMQYSDYAIWQRQAYESWSQREGGYWKQRLRNAVSVRIPQDGESERTSQRSYKTVQVSIGGHLTSSLRDFARHTGVAMSFVVVTLVVLVLSAWSGQRRFAIPMTSSVRYHRKHLDVIGYLPNFLPLRINLDRHATFGQLCSAISREFLTGVAHLDVGKTMDGGAPELLSGPFIQWFPACPNEVMLPTPSTWDADTLRLNVEPFATKWDPPSRGRRLDFPSGFALWEGPEGITAFGFFRPGLYAVTRTERFARDLMLTVSQVTCDPTTQVTSLVARLQTN
jgi:hypothetical protein